MRALPLAAAALLVVSAFAVLAPTATASTEECYGVVADSKFTGVCIVHNCLSSPSGSGIVVVVNDQRGRCIGL